MTSLSERIRDYIKAKAAHEEACANVSTIEERDGINAESPARTTAEQVQDKACKTELAARHAVSSFEASTGNELAQMVLALIDGHKLAAPLSALDREGLRRSAERLTGAAIANAGSQSCEHLVNPKYE